VPLSLGVTASSPPPPNRFGDLHFGAATRFGDCEIPFAAMSFGKNSSRFGARLRSSMSC
jgi:hypothetical protein